MSIWEMLYALGSLVLIGACIGAFIILVTNPKAVLDFLLGLLGKRKTETATVSKEGIKEKELIKEIVMIPCSYCGGLMPQTVTFCPNCGARRKV